MHGKFKYKYIIHGSLGISLDHIGSVYTSNPNGAYCFAWKRLCFGGLTFKIEGIGAPGVYIYIFIMYTIIYYLQIYEICCIQDILYVLPQLYTDYIMD